MLPCTNPQAQGGCSSAQHHDQLKGEQRSKLSLSCAVTVAQQSSAIIPVSKRTQGQNGHTCMRRSRLYVCICMLRSAAVARLSEERKCLQLRLFLCIHMSQHNACCTAAQLVQYARCSLILDVSVVLHDITATICTMQPLITTATVKIGSLCSADRATLGQYFIF
jgi:hypothetical protein